MKNPSRSRLKPILMTVCAAVSISLGTNVSAHDKTPGSAQFIANESVMISHGEFKILFDPLYETGFGTYPEFPPKDRLNVLLGNAPFDNIDAVFVSHAHGDHFSAEQMVAYLVLNKTTLLVAPQQALDQMIKAKNWDPELRDRITAIDMEFGDPSESFDIGGLKVLATRIPHAGWPGRANVQNMIFRVSLGEGATVMHMGDADINDAHYAPHSQDWQRLQTDMGFPPYWFQTSRSGQQILKDRLNVKEAVGIHVPIKRPSDLILSGNDYFYQPGDTRVIGEPD